MTGEGSSHKLAFMNRSLLAKFVCILTLGNLTVFSSGWTNEPSSSFSLISGEECGGGWGKPYPRLIFRELLRKFLSKYRPPVTNLSLSQSQSPFFDTK